MERRLAAILAADVAGYARLMGSDEAGTLTALQRQQSEVMAPLVARHRGRIVKLMGDGVLVEFHSAVEAVACAAELQRELALRNAPLSDERRLQLRIGVHIGDVIVAGDDIYGDGVNIAARLQGVAETGGIAISRQVYELVEGKLTPRFKAIGPQTLKNIARPVEVFAAPAEMLAEAGGNNGGSFTQEVKYCRAKDDVRLAYARIGRGPPLVKTANWMNHLEYDWESPVWGHLLHRLAGNHTLVRYDARGNGLSDWDVEEVSLDAWVGDLETVVEASRLERFPLFGISQGAPISIVYALRHPEKVSRLILYGGFARGGYKRSPEEAEKRRALATLIRLGWGQDHPTFRQIFTSTFIPDATKEQADFMNEWQRKTASPECAARYYEVTGNFDVTALLPQVSVPTLILHRRDDLVSPLASARELASGIPGARLVVLPGRNHMFLAHEPETERFFEEIELFLKE
jgi:class 3 adenylate cyclase/pimeloyl-ACP methyl ester carboxylesterase